MSSECTICCTWWSSCTGLNKTCFRCMISMSDSNARMPTLRICLVGSKYSLTWIVGCLLAGHGNRTGVVIVTHQFGNQNGIPIISFFNDNMVFKKCSLIFVWKTPGHFYVSDPTPLPHVVNNSRKKRGLYIKWFTFCKHICDTHVTTDVLISDGFVSNKKPIGDTHVTTNVLILEKGCFIITHQACLWAQIYFPK